MRVIVERHLSDQIAPGTRVALFAVVSVSTVGGRAASDSGIGRGGGGAVRTPYLRVVGCMLQQFGSGRTATSFTHEEDEAM